MSAIHPTARAEFLRLRGALYDRVTGLPSIPVLFDELRQLLETRRVVGLLHVTLPGLGTAESVYGWQTFDRLAARTADEMRALRGGVLSSSALLAQPAIHGGDVIAFVPEAAPGRDVTHEALHAMARAIEARLRAVFADEEFTTLVPRPDPQVGFSVLAEDPFFRFERLVYKAIDEARSRPARREQGLARSRTEELQQLIREEGVRVHYQPVVELETLEVIGYEALSRGPMGSALEAPATMFRISREAGIAAELDRLCRRLALSSARGIAAGRKIFLNSRADLLADPEWRHSRLEQNLARLDLQPGDLVVEVPHPGALTDESALERVLHDLKRRGFQIAIDDIGTGYAGIQWIERLSPDYLKIDISLVRGIHANLIQQDLLASLVRIGRRVGASVIAEGIEEAAELEFLRSNGARYGQGYLFSAAVPELVPGPMSLARPL